MTAAALAFNVLFLWFKVAQPIGLGYTLKKGFFNPYLTLGVDSPTFLSHVPLSWWLLLFSLPDSVSHLNSLYKLSRERSL